MYTRSGSPDDNVRALRVLVVGIYLGGIVFILEAVPLLFGGKGDWPTVLLHVAIASFVAMAAVWLLEPQLAKRYMTSSSTQYKPALNALKIGAIVTGIMFVLGFAMFASSWATGADFIESMTFALAMGTWSTLISYVSFKLTRKLSN
jgi:hypothetical protein